MSVRIATYTRISTDEAHQPYSLEAQRERLDSYARSQEGWQIVRRFSDQASGATLERPGLERALQEAQAQRFDLLLVYRVDRLARSVRGLVQLLEQLEDAEVSFRSASEPFDTSSSAGRMMVQLLGVFAEFERATIVISGMERKAARGEWTGGALPFGYRLDGERRHLEPEPREAPLVAEIFERYARRLEGSAALAAWLSERGYRTKQGKPFNPQAVLTILRNRAYRGEIFYRGTYYPAPHAPLVEAGLFERAGAILKQRGEDVSLRRSNRSDYLLTGLVKCARCGKRYVGAAAHSKSGRYSYYVCFTRQRYGRKECGADRLPAEELEEAVMAQLASVLEQEPLVRRAIEEAFAELERERPKREAALELLEQDLRRTNEALERYFRAFEEGTMQAAACGTRIEELTKKLSGLEARRAELSAEGEEEDREPLSEADLRALAAEVREVVDEGDLRQRKALLQALVHEVRVVSREEIYPFFFVPAVRPPSGSVPPARIELAHAV